MALKLNKKDTYKINVKDTMFEVQPISLSEEERILRKHTKIKKGVEVTNNVEFLKDKFDKTVINWNIAEIDGVENPECNKKNKDFIVEWFMSLATEILDKADEIRDDIIDTEFENLGK